MTSTTPTGPETAQRRRFAADAAHELRTPLAGLRAQLEEARLHAAETDLPRLLDATLRDVGRLEAILADLLLLTQVEAGAIPRLRPVDLTATVRAHAVPRPGGPGIRLRTLPAVIVNAVPGHLGRLVTSLLDNAGRHARRSIEVEVRRQDAIAELTVADDGPGIPARDRERVFELFARLDAARCRRRGGAGLGLTIARDIAHAHGGTLHVEDAHGGGARFVLRLPARHVAAHSRKCRMPHPL
ncbi:sensor histidine kinase [Microbispora sp. NPDC049125]|uniref:sensor histidine kinase n=1 Tax=Microbispora sp. NPDC049125 TaxID=3154929 RepID=UPI003466CB3E